MTMRALSFSLLGLLLTASCGGDPAQNLGEGDSVLMGGLSFEELEERDLLFVVDSSPESAPFAAQWVEMISERVRRLVSVECRGENGLVSWVPPEEPCPEGARTRAPTTTSLHVGVLSTSLGSAGGACSDGSPASGRTLDEDWVGVCIEATSWPCAGTDQKTQLTFRESVQYRLPTSGRRYLIAFVPEHETDAPLPAIPDAGP